MRHAGSGEHLVQAVLHSLKLGSNLLQLLLQPSGIQGLPLLRKLGVACLRIVSGLCEVHSNKVALALAYCM